MPGRDVTRESARSPTRDGLRLHGLRLKKVPGHNIFHETTHDHDHDRKEGLRTQAAHLVTSETHDVYGFEGGLKTYGDRNAVVETENPYAFPRGFKKKHFQFHNTSPHVEGSGARVVEPATSGTQRSHESSDAHSGHVTAGPTGLMPSPGYQGCGILPSSPCVTTATNQGFGDVTGGANHRRSAAPVSKNADEEALKRGPKTGVYAVQTADHIGELGIASSDAVAPEGPDLGDYDTTAANAKTKEASDSYKDIKNRSRGGSFSGGAFLAAD